MFMATKTIIVMGRPRDGETSATSGTLAKKINDVTTGAATFQLALTKLGCLVVATIVYTEAE